MENLYKKAKLLNILSLIFYGFASIWLALCLPILVVLEIGLLKSILICALAAFSCYILVVLFGTVSELALDKLKRDNENTKQDKTSKEDLNKSQ